MKEMSFIELNFLKILSSSLERKKRLMRKFKNRMREERKPVLVYLRSRTRSLLFRKRLTKLKINKMKNKRTEKVTTNSLTQSMKDARSSEKTEKSFISKKRN